LVHPCSAGDLLAEGSNGFEVRGEIEERVGVWVSCEISNGEKVALHEVCMAAELRVEAAKTRKSDSSVLEWSSEWVEITGMRGGDFAGAK
jgi:hypothetical protein